MYIHVPLTVMSNEVGLCYILCVILQLSTPVQPRVCTRALDVVFVLEAGRNISDTDWNLTVTLALETSYQLHASTYGTHVAQVQFSGSTSVVHGLDTRMTVHDRDKSLVTGRKLSNAIDTTRRLVLNNVEGDRPEVQDVIVPFVTHELADDKDRAVAAAARAKSDGIRIFPVGIANGLTQVDQLRKELREIATDAEDVDHLMLVSRQYSASVVTVLVSTLCRNRVEAANESLRLVDGTSNTGRLEVYIDKEWLTICSTGWKHLNTRIACKQLGFPDGQSAYTVNQTYHHRRIGVANIQCTGNETYLLQCSNNPFFQIDSSCNHQRDVYLRCLCSDCNDYIPRDNVRLADRTSISGRLEVIFPGVGWAAMCSTGWTTSNTRVACRQLGFRDGAGAYHSDHNQSISFMSFHISCVGDELSLVDCNYTPISTGNCSHSVYIRCECNECLESLLEAPRQRDAMTQSTEVFEWRLNRNVSAFEILFLSQKNPERVVYVEQGKMIEASTRFRNRIQLINDDFATVGFHLRNITTADMGIYSLYVPELLLDSKAILIVTDFAVVPDPVVYRQINDSAVLSWDLTALRRLSDIDNEILLTTPATGRLHLDSYYVQWLRDNPDRHGLPQSTDQLHLKIVIDRLTAKDAGKYVIEVTLTSVVYRWLNFSLEYSTELAMITDYSYPCQTNSVNVPAIVLSVLLGLSIIPNIVLIRVYCKRGTDKRECQRNSIKSESDLVYAEGQALQTENETDAVERYLPEDEEWQQNEETEEQSDDNTYRSHSYHYTMHR